MIHIPASRIAIALGLWGLVPFIVPAVCLWLVAPSWQDAFARALVAYGAVILSFLGGMHWGSAVEGSDEPKKIERYVYAVCPSLLAVVALMCPPDKGLFLLFLGLMAAFFVDRRVYASTKWFVILRAVLTAVATLCLYAGYKALQH
ncbi:MAG: DUF3429 domain-containing protein [Proteobacteria bacterium]|nr:DUF3429 domain-containing protein [Pseudomonadota bacterium]